MRNQRKPWQILMVTSLNYIWIIFGKTVWPRYQINLCFISLDKNKNGLIRNSIENVQFHIINSEFQAVIKSLKIVAPFWNCDSNCDKVSWLLLIWGHLTFWNGRLLARSPLRWSLSVLTGSTGLSTLGPKIKNIYKREILLLKRPRTSCLIDKRLLKINQIDKFADSNPQG